MIKFTINQKKEYKNYIYFYLLIFLILLVIGCSKNINKEESAITASVIEDVKENCRFANESDCRPIEIRRGDAENEEPNNTENANLENDTSKIINISEEILLSNCTDGWKCVEKNYRAYQFSNCSWTSVEHCIYGCKNDTCKPAPICKLNSLKCDKDNLLICGEEGYEWKLNESCDFQCQNGICIGRNENITNATNSNNATQANLCYNNCISITNFHYDASGDDCNVTNLNDEYVVFKNNCAYSCDLTNWNLSDNANVDHSYIFPSFNLVSQATFTLYTGNGTDAASQLYWKSTYTPCPAIWNNVGDTLYLRNSSNDLILTYSYP